jgi:hypothetical protein
MDKNAIKKFAAWARRELISRVSQRAVYFEITEAGFGDPATDIVLGRVLSDEEKAQRQALIAQIRQKGYQQVMEEVAYTWFNRFIALRFMEVNGYLPSHVRVFTDEANQFNPQILAEAIHMELDGLDMQKVYAFKNANDDDGLFKYMVIVQCNALSSPLPGMFQRISDYTELLFPDNLLREGSVLQQMIELIPEEDWKDAVQIIGWLYQYYNAEKKDEVFAALKKNVKITKENIPAATQLFTPDWIVRYMVENSLGRLWLEHLAATGEGYHYSYVVDGKCTAATYVNADKVSALKGNWRYYLDEAPQKPEVQAQLAEIGKEYATMTPEQIKCIDPCCGSGHILAYLFDVLMQIYESYGYTTREAVASIVQNNLYGLDIDDRAAQLAYFSVMMKARQYDRRFFNRGIQPHVYAIRESNGVDRYTLEYFYNGDAKLQAAMDSIIMEMHDAKEYGSILNITPVDFAALYTRFDQVRNDIDFSRKKVLNILLPLVQVAETLARKYDVAITNPPYLSARGSMSQTLTKYLSKNFPLSKNDMFTVFMDVCEHMTKQRGFYSLVNQQSWMFLAGFAKLRDKIYNNDCFVNLIHIGAGAFDGIAGEVVQSVAFSIFKYQCQEYRATYIDMTGAKWKIYMNDFKAISHKYEISIREIRDIPNGILCYHLGGAAINRYYSGKRLDSYADPRVGMATGENELFVRLWPEVRFDKIGIGFTNGEDTIGKPVKWFPYNKGGECRRWYGNRTHLVDWEDNGRNINAFKQGRLLRGEIEKKNSECWNREYYFMESISWSKVSSGRFAVRYYEPGFIFDVAGCSILGLGRNLYYVMGALNSELRNAYIEALSPTLNFETGAIKAFPIIANSDKEPEIVELVKMCIGFEKDDWDAFETSWDFQNHPLVRLKENMKFNVMDGDSKTVSYFLQGAYRTWENECEERFTHLKANEEELNRIFIDIYALQDELTPEVADKDVTVHYPVDTKDDIPASLQGSNYVLTRRDAVVSLLSYAVGCMFGRYTIYEDGLFYAGGPWDYGSKIDRLSDSARKNQVENWIPSALFLPDEDNIIPICDDEYFNDDIVGRFVKFIETVYGSDTLEENLKFIADALGGKGTPRDVLRSYFLNDFYTDHCKTYQKRPIYWLFDSGKKNGFKALIYMHRYQPDTIARIRTDYVHEQQSRYRTAIADLESRIAAASTAERVKLNKQLKKLLEQDAELRTYEEKIHHLADQMISIDLDDGVKVNYAKFQDVLGKIK